MFIPDPGSWLWIVFHPGSRIQGSKEHRIPDPQHCVICNLTPVLRIRNKSFGSGYGSGSGLKLVSDPVSDPDSNPDPNPGSGTGQVFFCTKIFTQPHLQGSISSVTWLRTKCAKNWRSMRILHIHICILSVYSVPPPCR